jgi:hypothetical protein
VKSGRKVINKSIHLLRPLPPVPLPPFPQVLLGVVDGRKNMLKQGGKKTKKPKKEDDGHDHEDKPKKSKKKDEDEDEDEE